MRIIAFGWFTASGGFVARPGSFPDLLSSVISAPEKAEMTSEITESPMSSSAGLSSLLMKPTSFVASSEDMRKR